MVWNLVLIWSVMGTWYPELGMMLEERVVKTSDRL